MFNRAIGIILNSSFSRFGFSVNFHFEALVGSMEKNIQKVDGGISLEWEFEILQYANAIHTNLQFKVTEYKICVWIFSKTSV
jgi:hypothetical protein